MTYATGNVFGPTQPDLAALVASYKTKTLGQWSQKSPYGSMLACCSDNFLAEFWTQFSISMSRKSIKSIALA
jgi:hypothetical protein